MSLSKTLYSVLSTGSTQEDPSRPGFILGREIGGFPPISERSHLISRRRWGDVFI